MKAILLVFLLVLLIVPMTATADPVDGVYNSTDYGGELFTGRASTWRTGINSGMPHVLHAQSWDGTTLGAQWEIRCAVETVPFGVVDNRIDGVGTIVYTSQFVGGTFTFYPGSWPWGDGSGILGVTDLITTVQFYMIGGTSTPVSSVVNGNTYGEFDNGCLLLFAIGNGTGMGETTSLNPSITIPADYPSFMDDNCDPASVDQQFGTWGTVTSITFGVDCTEVPNESETWSSLKATYR